MKRILSVTTALLLLMLALAGCGGNAEESAGTEETQVNQTEPAETETTETETAEPAEETEAEASGLPALADQMIADAGITDAIPVSADALAGVYGLDPAQIAEAAGYNASSGGAFPQEIILVKAVDSDGAAAVAQAFANRLSDIAEQAESYDPDSYSLAQKCQVITQGDYVGLFFSDQYDQLTELFLKGVQ